MSETPWIEHDGKGMPVPNKTVVEVKFRDGFGGKVIHLEAGFWGSNWEHDTIPCGADITAYRIISPSPTPTTPPKTGV